ncbi:helicase-related protein [Nocardioides speluncae]|uniref:helicase-related protein n=1 Tax=Nocardioides speluncae TaxID=2670337 RepID=UPI000D69AAF9|nr:helicase-related protein [Nocardioides speluncae]
MPDTARRAPSAPTDASPRNRSEAAVTDWLIDRLAARLADRVGQRHAPPWEPRQNVLVGVLEPIRVRPAAAPSEDTEESTDGGTDGGKDGGPTTETVVKPAGEIPSLGVDFRLAVDAGVDAVDLDVEVRFALYLEEIATLAEQLSYIGAADPALSKTSIGTEAAGPGLESASEEAGAAAVAEKPKGRRANKTRLLGAWRRYNADVGTVTITVPLDGGVVTLDEHLTAAAAALIAPHYESPNAMRPFTRGRNEIPRDALANEAALAAAVEAALDRDWVPTIPHLTLAAFAQPLGDGEYLVSVTLRNATEVIGRNIQDFSVYDCSLAVHPGAGSRIVPQRFDLAPNDYRLAEDADVIGRGTSCVAVATGHGGIRSETLPVHIQSVTVPRTGHVADPEWAALAADPTPILRSVQDGMETFATEFTRFVAAAAGQPHHADAQRELDQFADELRRFRLGRTVINDDPHLAHAFTLANEVFVRANAGKPFQTWRLFQLVYIVSHLPALAARENSDPDLRAELDHVDVLWFPAGGGKTEAYLGLIITALFYDRLRSKDAGVTSWLRFPLRMLSVQQLARMLRVLVIAENLRTELDIGSHDADPFALGYLVGGRGTPNKLAWPATWWHGWETEARLAAKGDFIDDHLEDRLVTSCPYCDQETVVLDLDVDAVRIIHRCTNCDQTLPLYMTDEEVYRYLPAVVISTVDKLTGYTWFGEYTAFSHGPAHRCPDHGYFSFPHQGTCLVGKDLCPPPKGGHPVAAPIKDPVPSLTIQDEMHLLKEELGAFSGHYEGLIAELQRGGPSGLPTKILAASATIEQYQDQLRQVYGRWPRAFPAPGYDRTFSFYTETLPDVRRTFVGILPNYRRKADVAATVQCELLAAVAELQDDGDPLAKLGADPTLWDTPPDREAVLDLLFCYEVSLGYVNSKAHGAKLDEELRSLSDRHDFEGRDAVDRVVLTGEVPIPDLADAISRVQGEHLTTPRRERLRAIVGTSVVSHGVDLDRLNVLVLAGMPTTAADYIQVTARAGRTHAGLVVTVYDAFSRRERSLFSNFATYHRFLDQMVTPVPVNKYAFFVADRTVPGLVLALLHDMARDPGLGGPAQGVRLAKDFQGWWNSRRATIDAHIRDRLLRCYETPIDGVNDAIMERELGRRAMARWVDVEYKALSRPAEENNTTQLFNQPPLPNFRDIDEPADFGAYFRSRDAFEAVTGQRSGPAGASTASQAVTSEEE